MIKFLRIFVLSGIMILVFSGMTLASAQSDVACPDGEPNLVMTAGQFGEEAELINEILDNYMALCPNVTVSTLEVEGLVTDRLGLYIQFLGSKSPAVDIYLVDVIWPGILAEHMVDLYQYAAPDSEAVTQHLPSIIENNTVDGKLVGMPWFTDAGLFFYRTDLLEKYGVDVPQTWDELQQTAKLIQDGERAEGKSDFWGYIWQGNIGEPTTINALEWQASNGGGVIISPDGQIQVNNPETISALERAKSWIGTISPSTVLGHTPGDSLAIWTEGNAAFMRNWPFAIETANAEDSVVAGKFDVGPLPAGDAGARAMVLGGWQLSVSQYSQNPDAAAALVLYLTSPEVEKYRAIQRGDWPTIPALYQDEEVLAAQPVFSRLDDVINNTVARPSTITGSRYNEASTLYSNAVHSVLRGDEDAIIAMEDLEFDLEDLMIELGY
jgi:trehalose/maltose transport system substrate-binding protein